MKPWKLLLVLLGLLFLFTRCSPQRNEQETLPFETKVEGTTTEAVTESIKESEEETRSEESDTGILFYSFTKNFGGRTSKVFVLEMPKDSKEYMLLPVPAYNEVFGYRLLSEIIEKHNAEGGVNGGFSYAYGRHGGVLIQGTEFFNWKTDQYPVLVYKDGQCFFMESKDFSGHIEIKGQRMKIHGVNKPHEYVSNVIIYNPLYGKTDRLDQEYFCVTVVEDVIQKAEIVSGEKEIPNNGYLITVGKPFDQDLLTSFFVPFEKVTLHFDPVLKEGDWAYECGDRLVEDGKNVAPMFSGWVGTLESYDPRTAVGINASGNPVFVLVDGRQPGYSIGVTAKELSDIMIELGITEGALLDGGANSEMIINGEIVNRPSFKGQERPMATAFVIVKKKG
jgi:hypothetical protein